MYGIGTKAIYGPPGESDLAQSYGGMVELLQALRSEAAWTCDSRVQLATFTKTEEPDWKHEDKFHGDCEFKNSLTCGKMHAAMVNLMTAAQQIIDLGQVYKDVRVDNPMGAYTTKVPWEAADYPGLTFGELYSTAVSTALTVLKR